MIERINITGFKSIKEVDIELSSINILIGSNAAGKSNFISVFKLLNIIYEKQLKKYSLTKGIDNLLHFGKKTTGQILIKIRFKKKTDPKDSNSYIVNLIPTENETLFIKNERTGYNTKWDDDNSDYFFSNNITESQIKESDIFRDSYLRSYLKSFKVFHFHDTSENSPLRSSSRIDDNIYFKENGSNLASFLFLLQEKHPKSFYRIQKVVESVVPGFDSFNLKPDRFNSDLIKLEWHEKNHHDTYFNAQNLSDGSLRFIALATLLLQPELPKTIIIDEPELGLHPFAINKLAGLIKSASEKGAQIIISTQSVNLLDSFETENVITVDKEDNSTTLRKLDSQELENWINEYTLGELWIKNIIDGQV